MSVARWIGVAGIVVAGATGCVSSRGFHESFRGAPGLAWTILREQPEAWRRVPGGGLEIRALPGNMWGPANDARNVWVRALPDPARGPVSVTITVENRPTEQYEQVDLVWYYADSHQVKIGQELVDGKLSLVMGREESDRTRTLAILPITSAVVHLKLEASGREIVGWYRESESDEWTRAGACELPVQGDPKVALQVYQGPTGVEHWARLTDLRVQQGR